MTMHVNLLLFSGRLVRDPELRKAGPSTNFPDGTPVCNITLVQNARVKRGDEWTDGDPIFIDVALWGRRAEAFSRHHKKGDEALIQGRLRFDVWTDGEGQKRSKLKADADDWQFIPRSDGRAGGRPAEDTPF